MKQKTASLFGWQWRRFFVYVAWLLSIMLSSAALAEATVFTYRSPESDKDKRYDYDKALLQLALEKTVAEYGDYQLRPSKVMNIARAIMLVKHNLQLNFFIKLSYDEQLSEQMAYAPFPVDLGIVGYRVCFVSPLAEQRLAKAPNLTTMKQLVHGQGRGWVDVDILRHNGFMVKEVSLYENLFSMVAINRFDLFCRGINELLEEHEAHKGLEGLTYDTKIALEYPLPRFFYTHHSNKVALERVSKGLVLAYEDGSLQKLWLDNYQKSIEFSQLENRTIYHLENPHIKNIDFDFQPYFYRPKIRATPAHTELMVK